MLETCYRNKTLPPHQNAVRRLCVFPRTVAHWRGGFSIGATMESILQKFWANVNKNGPITRPSLGRCWQWQGSKDKKGYGCFSFNATPYRAHRFAYARLVGRIPKTKPHVLHHCDNPSCVRPKHLWAGTNLDNISDRDKKNRQARGASHGCNTHPETRCFGERNGRAILNANQVLVIRLHHASGQSSTRQLSDKYGVCMGTIRDICHVKIWRHL